MKKVNQGTIVNEIVVIGGVSKENAVNIFNIFTNAWSADRIGLLKAVDTGIAVKRRKATKKTAKKATKKAAPKSTEKVTKKVTKESTKKKTTSPIAKVKTKVKTKGKVKTKKKLKKNVLPPSTTTGTQSKTA